MTLEEQRLELDKVRFAHEQRIDDLKLDLDRLRLEAESRFANRHLGSLVTGVVSFAAVVVSLSQVFIASTSKQKELELLQIQKRAEMEMNSAQQSRDWNLKAAEFILTHQDLIFGKDLEKQVRVGKVMLVTFPPQITGPLFEKFAVTTTDVAAQNEWKAAQGAASKLLLIRVDGLYQAKESEGAWSYLRFFPDGTVMSVTSTGTPAEVARWLKPGAHDNKGSVKLTKAKDERTYAIEGAVLKFSTTSPEGTVDYEGTVEGDKLRLDSFSHINNHRDSEEYTFVSVGL